MAKEDFQEFLTALSAAGVRHIVVGAYALGAHGYVRGTGDFDVLIESNIFDVEVQTLNLDAMIAAKSASIDKRQPGSTKAFQDQADLAWLLAERARRRR